MNKHFLGVRYTNIAYTLAPKPRNMKKNWFTYSYTSMWWPGDYRFDGQIFHTLDQKYKKNIRKLMKG